jgi:RNA polymerase sigma-70 factor (ECF subfamily)
MFVVLPRDGPLTSHDLLLREAKEGSAEAFESLATRYRRRVIDAALRLTGDVHDAHDVAQHVLVQLYLNLAKFDDRSRLGAWVNAVTLHRCQDVKRERSQQSARPRPLDAGGMAPGPEDVAVRRDLSRRVRAAVAAMPRDYRRVLELRHFRAFPLDAIAEELGLPVKTVKSLAWKAERRLRVELVGRGLDGEPR